MTPLCAMTLWALVTGATPSPLTLADALVLARQRSPSVLTALTTEKEERAARVGATPLVGRNPWVEGGAGVVVDNGQPFPTSRGLFVGGEAWLLVNVPVELAMERQRRLSAADARIRVAGMMRDEAIRQALLVTSEAFFLALHAQETFELSEEAVRHARASLRVVEEGLKSGTRTQLEANFAALALGADEARLAAAEAGRRHALHRLLTMLGLTESDAPGVSGTFLPSSPLPPVRDARAHVMQRADVRVLEAQRISALADANLASAGKFPSPVLKAGYQYWRTEHAALTYVEMPLPVFQRGQGDEARARARASSLSDEVDARLRSAMAEVENAHALAREMSSARALLDEKSVRPARELQERLEADFNARLIDVNALLTGRRMVLEARREAVDAALREALARLHLDAAMGLLR